MPSVTVHYDGWVQLPERLRNALSVATGGRLDAEVVDGGLLLRAAQPTRLEAKAPEEASAAVRTAAHEEPDAPHEQVPEIEGKATVGRVAPGIRKARGKRKAAGTAEPGVQTG